MGIGYLIFRIDNAIATLFAKTILYDAYMRLTNILIIDILHIHIEDDLYHYWLDTLDY